MNRRVSVCLAAISFLTFVLHSAVAHETANDRAPPIRYEVIPVGPPPGAESFGWFEPVDLNDRGELIGTGYDPGGVQFIWDCRRGRIEIPFLPNSFDLPMVTAINELGRVAGYNFSGPENSETAFIWDRRTGIRPLMPMAPGDISMATDINLFGIVLGQHRTLEPYRWATFVWSEYFGRFDLPDSDLIYSRINDRGVLAAHAPGESSVLLLHPLRGLRQSAALPEGAGVSSIDGLNDRNDVVGVVYMDGKAKGFVARHDGQIDLFAPLEGAPAEIMPRSINNRREVVGTQWGFGYGEAFIWDRLNGMRDLTQLVTATNAAFSHLSFDKAAAINDAGWIAARAFDNESYTSHTYLLVPVPADQERYRNLHLLTGQALCDALPRSHIK